MSRSNSPAANPSGWPASRAPSGEQEQQSWSAWLKGRRGGAPQEPQPGYHQPQYPQADPYAQHGEGYDAYGQPQQPAYGYPPPQPAYDPHARHAGYAPEPGLSQLGPRGAPSQQDYGQLGPAPDSRGYDLSSFPPADRHPFDARYDQGYGAHVAEPDPGSHLYPMHPPHDPGQGALEPYGHEDGDYEVEEPRRGGRTFLVLGAIVGAVAAGGGLAYGYKTFFAPKTEVATPLVRGDSRPDKTKPADPGGKQFANTDSKILGRLGDAPGAAAPVSVVSTPAHAAASEESDSANGRRVQTVTVARDGSIVPPPAPAVPPTTVSVPGLTIVDGFGGPTRSMVPTGAPPPVQPQRTAVATTTSSSAPSGASSSAPSPTVAAAAPPAQKPVVVAKAPPPAPAAVEADEPDAVVAPPKKSPPPKHVETATTAPSGLGVSGYVAVLASVPASPSSRMDALKRFADMQQKYNSVLQNKTPDVQEANLGAKGTYHRLLVGPPGSREQASAVCTQLKAAGYSGCWVTAY